VVVVVVVVVVFWFGGGESVSPSGEISGISDQET
jgi:hypothetical protein